MSNINIESLNSFAARWAAVMWAVSWQFCVLGVVVLAIHVALRRAAPNWRYWLWQILAIKLLLMPFWTATAPWKWPASDSKVETIAELPRREDPAIAAPASSPTVSESKSRRFKKAVNEIAKPSQVVKPAPSAARHQAEQQLASMPATQSQDFDSTSPSERPGSSVSRLNISGQSKSATPLTPNAAPDRKQAQATRPSISIRQQSVDVATNEDTPVQSTVAIASLPAALTRTTGLTWQAWLMLGWAGGVLLIGSRIVWQGFSLNRRLRQTDPAEPTLVQRVRDAASQLGMTRIPDVRVIDLDISPFVCGLWTTRLIIPRGLSGSFTAEQLDLVLLHELAHVRRRDLVWGWIPELAKVLFFFHPLVHFLCYQIRFERELACDQLAMQLSGHDVATYADTLVRVVGHFSVPDSFRIAVVESPPL